MNGKKKRRENTDGAGKRGAALKKSAACGEQSVTAEEDFNAAEAAAENSRRNMPRVIIFGAGGAGCKIVGRLRGSSRIFAEYRLLDDCAESLAGYTGLDRIKIGPKPGGGFDCGRQACLNFKEDILRAMRGADIVVTVAGLGGAGSGASAAIAEIARDCKVHCVAVAAAPLSSEGEERLADAQRGAQYLAALADAFIAVPCEKVRDILPSTASADEIFTVADNAVIEILNALISPVTCPMVVNLDISDVLTTLRRSGDTYFGTGVACGEDRAAEAVKTALNCPLANTEFKNVKGAIAFIEGGDDLTLDEAADAAALIRAETAGTAEIVIALNTDKSLTGALKVSVLAAKSSPEVGVLYSFDDGKDEPTEVDGIIYSDELKKFSTRRSARRGYSAALI